VLGAAVRGAAAADVGIPVGVIEGAIVEPELAAGIPGWKPEPAGTPAGLEAATPPPVPSAAGVTVPAAPVETLFASTGAAPRVAKKIPPHTTSNATTTPAMMSGSRFRSPAGAAGGLEPGSGFG
jgi:hypothetical protein